MSYLVLARKYRSTGFDDVVGQDHVAKTLKRAIESGRIAHAYLFCGTRGVGKTSMARILAKALNCESAKGPTTQPCNKCNSCTAIARGDDIDVIEIDAASNTGVDNVRDLIANSQFHPARSRFKVYIIDEVHMLSKQAFNALLKILEEPPGHVKFILATTEAERVLPTILSRCQRYDFRNISTREIADHLADICKKEKIKADPQALMLIAKAGAGSMRDALSLLDRLLSYGEKDLSVEMLEQLLGMPRTQVISELVDCIGQARVKELLSAVDEQLKSGMSVDTLVGGLIDHLRNLLVIRTCGQDSQLVEVPGLSLGELSTQAAHFEPADLSQDIAILEDLRRSLRSTQAGRALLDATLVRLALAEQFTPVGAVVQEITTGVPAPLSTAPALKKNAERTAIDDSPQSNISPIDLNDLDGIWRTLLGLLSAKGHGLPALLAGAKLVGIEDGTAVVRFTHDHDAIVQMLDRNGKKDAIRQVLQGLLKQNIDLKLELEAAPETVDAPAPRARVAMRHSPPPSSLSDPAPARITPELKQALREDPLIAAVIEQLGGEIVKVEQ